MKRGREPRKALLDDSLYWSGYSWKYAYLNHPVLNKLARLLVWRYSAPFVKHTFILTDRGPIQSDGSAYEIGDHGSIRVAHPVEIGKEEVAQWRHCLADEGLVQPFDQITIPVTRIGGKDLESRYAIEGGIICAAVILTHIEERFSKIDLDDEYSLDDVL